MKAQLRLSTGYNANAYGSRLSRRSKEALFKEIMNESR